MSLTLNTIGQVAKALDISPHTLRYYEKIGLLPNITKDNSGKRQYEQSHIAQIQFIRRAQRMQFSLAEIKQLLLLDTSAAQPKPAAQSMVKKKLQQIDENLHELAVLKNDLMTLLNRCTSSQNDEKCPIIEGMKTVDQAK